MTDIFHPLQRFSATSTEAFRAALFALALACSLLAGACLSPNPSGDQAPPLGGPEYSALVVSSDLARGSNRLVFTLVNRDNIPVNAAEAQVSTKFTAPGASTPEVRKTGTASFLPWPPEGSNRGVFVALIDFDEAGEATRENPGLWEMDISATRADGVIVEATTALRVAEEGSTPGIGDPAPGSVTPIAADFPDLSHISSAPTPDPELYKLSIHEALEEGKPLVVLFSTPAFCVSAMCGPQLEILTKLKEIYRDRANFIHVEVFQDPHLIEGNRFAAKQVPAVEEWGLPTEPWTFIIGSDGLVKAKYEQFTPESVLVEALEGTF